ncbi:MAG: peptidylprolyl isomerase [Leptospiraceae bacterium]|nr:peptidylprolyl isomerase [Leptospiraceae bacterium]MDW7976825.1 peptidylprolyl isomerase [Leptospiraceae bacterium]
MKVRKNTVVTIDYVLKDDFGNILDSTQGRSPLKYLHGNGNLIPGIEKALEGKEKGDFIKVSIPPEDGYGYIDESLIQEVPKEIFEDPEDLEIGMQFSAQTEEGTYILTVKEIREETVIVDGNHPLAGKNLNFEIRILNIREATLEEIAHRHAH